MFTKVSSTNRRGFLKGMAVGAGGYALGSLLTHPKEAMGNLSRAIWKKSHWNPVGILLLAV